MWVAGGAAVALAAFLPWSGVILAVALVFFGLALLALFAPPLEVHRGQSLRELFAGLGRWSKEPGAIPLALFILLYKMPDAALGVMTRTFWVDAGVSVEEIGTLLAPLTLVTTVGGAALGGVIVARTGLLPGLFWLGLAQSISNLSYSVVDWAGRPRGGVIAAAGIESFCSGLSTAAFLSLLMRVCERERAATEYALLTALFAATRELTGAVSGDGVELLGYGGWFASTMLLAVPSLALLFTSPLAARAREPALTLWRRGPARS
jgi:PAT family beta-lactamase induction signal transducer AmpG